MPEERSSRKKALDEVDPRQGPLDEGDVTEPAHEDAPMEPLIPVDR